MAQQMAVAQAQQAGLEASSVTQEQVMTVRRGLLGCCWGAAGVPRSCCWVLYPASSAKVLQLPTAPLQPLSSLPNAACRRLCSS
jgi:hypothetical protein